MVKTFLNYTLSDFKNMAKTLEKEYKHHSNIAKLHQYLTKTCVEQGNSQNVCDTSIEPAVQLILSQIWNMKFDSKQTVLNDIANTIDKSEPIHLTKEHKQAITVINDMNHQHDEQLLSTNLSDSDKTKFKNIQNQSKQLVRDINKNYNDYYEVWVKLKALEQEYINDYNEYNNAKIEYKNGQIPIPIDLVKHLEDIYNRMSNVIIPGFKRLNTTLDNILIQRRTIVEQFYNLYLSMTPSQRKLFTMPLNAVDIHKKIYTQSKHDKPVTYVKDCIKKTWYDAVQEGFNISFYAPCHIRKQPEVLKCMSTYDWPYIEYEPNVFTPWSSEHKYSEWMNSCLTVEQHSRPYIGKI